MRRDCMKYGLLFHRKSTNFGDDIQSYAISRFLPHIDYYIAREQIDAFQSENNEPVAVIMAAWWMWKKWNWPPAECIIPKLISMHLSNYTVRQRATPMKNEWLTGIGKEYFDAYGPVGARDQSSLEILQKCGIDSYFSGCITLTLPEQKVTEDKDKYVVLVDLKPEIKEKVVEWLSGSGLEIREFSHLKRDEEEKSYEDRLETVENVLTLYQNAKFVVTRRLHVTLPCVAMKVPVFSIIDMRKKGNKERWHPYCEWVNFMTEEEVLEGAIPFDNCSLPPNKPEYRMVREELISEIQSFVEDMESYPEDISLEKIKKTQYSPEEAKKWQFYQMKRVLDKWLAENRNILADLDLARDRNIRRREKIQKLEAKNQKLAEKNRELEQKNQKLREKNKQLSTDLKEALREPTMGELADVVMKKAKRKVKK